MRESTLGSNHYMEEVKIIELKQVENLTKSDYWENMYR